MSDLYDDEIVEYNESILGDEQSESGSEVVVYSRDWTVETIVSQIKQGNIDLDPDYQRRNAWQDDKRSKLIESLIMEYPVPEVVLAEKPNEKKKYMVIDGKQRLMAIYGFYNPSYQSWDRPVLRGLRVKSNLNNCNVEQLGESDARSLSNADLRCTMISSFKNEDVLYDIFYRLNTGSSPLTTQELRQVLHKGPFAKFLIKATEKDIPLHHVLNLKGPDNRLKDAEILLKFIAVEMFFDTYEGNLKKFLDKAMSRMNAFCADNDSLAEREFFKFNSATNFLIDIFDDAKKVGRKWNLEQEKWEGRFNRSVFEAQVHYVAHMDVDPRTINSQKFVEGVKQAFDDTSFRSAIESTTKTVGNHKKRFSILQKCLNESLGIETQLGFL